MELFKELEYKGNIYFISNYGRVFRNNVELPIRENADGYCVVSTNDYGKFPRSTGVHRLVRFAFIPNDDVVNKTEINHKDYDRKNNHVENLEWMSHADNIRYSAHRKNIFGDKNPNFGNRKLSSFYKENPDIALEKQSRKGLSNGRCRKIQMFKDDLLIHEFDYIALCCEFIQNNYSPKTSLNGIRGQINKAIKLDRKYKGLTFKIF